MSKFKFMLGTHVLKHMERTDVPLFISIRQLKNRKKEINSLGEICVDSGAFSELSLFGEWRTSPSEYNSQLKRVKSLGVDFLWASQQDYMCEDYILSKTGLNVREHQRRTVENYLELREISEFNIIPVLQGREIVDYMNHLELFLKSGVDLTKEKVVGVGSVCKRQSSDEIYRLMKDLLRFLFLCRASSLHRESSL